MPSKRSGAAITSLRCVEQRIEELKSDLAADDFCLKEFFAAVASTSAKSVHQTVSGAAQRFRPLKLCGFSVNLLEKPQTSNSTKSAQPDPSTFCHIRMPQGRILDTLDRAGQGSQ